MHYWFKSYGNFAELILGLLRTLTLQKRILTAESPQNSPRRPQTAEKGIGKLCAKCATQEVFDGFVYRRSQLSHFMGKIEGSQTCVYTELA